MSNIIMRARLAWLSGILGLVAAGTGGISLLVRLLGPAGLDAFVPSYLAAVAVILCGCALVFTARGSGSSNIRLARTLAWATIVLCLATFLAFILLEIPLLHDVVMAPISAMMVLILAFAILLVQRHWTVNFGQVLALIGLTFAIVAIVGYFEGLEILGSPFPIRLPVALALAAIAAGVLFARPDQGPMKIVTSATSAGRVARRLMLPLILLPSVLNVLFHHMPESAWRIAPEVNNVLFTLSSMLIIAGLAWWQVLTLYRSEQRDRQFQERARQAQGQYELVVQAITD